MFGQMDGFTYLRFIIFTLSSFTAVIPGVISENTSTKTVKIRVFEKAPRGTLIYHVSGSSFLDITRHRLFKLVQTGPDQDRFGLTKDNTLRVHEYPNLTGALDHVYTVYIEARTVDSRKTLISRLKIQIIVSKTNTFPPVFEETPQFEVFRYIQEGTIIGQVQVSDADVESYNRESVFSLSPSHSTPFSISEQTGVLRTTQSLGDAPKTFSLKVTAINTGSPQIKKASTLTVVIREISEPLGVSIAKHNLTHVEACWQRPSYGHVTRYELRLEKQQKSSTVTRRLIKPESTDEQCLVFTLDPHQAYMVTIRAMDGPTLGLPTRVKFRMERSRCGAEVCTGKCVFTPDGATCLCDGDHRNCGYSGRCSDCAISDQTFCQCEEGDRSCESECGHTCLNNGQSLLDSVGKYYCHCLDGFYGKRCEMQDPCADVSCENGGTCMNISSSEYQCMCESGFYGQHCNQFNPCSKRPCLNAGQCTNISSSAYRCTCKHGFYGEHCQRYDPCFVRPCLNNGQCRNVSDTSYTCTCAPGYYGDSCEVYHPCSSNPCLYGGFCNSVDGQYECHCPRGRFGRKCEHVNLCIQLEPCGDHKVTCHNMTDFGYKCICEPGWHGENCTDFDACFDQPCQHGGVCKQSSDFTYTCICHGTYYGENCERTNLCASYPCQNGATCRNISNHDYHCECLEGYFGETCEKYDTCHNSPCLNGGVCQNSSQAENVCICPETYLGDFCQHYNSCSESPCGQGRCQVDRNGFYSCECESGYHGINCELYDPCLSTPCQNRGVCAQTRDGNYGCLCEDHYYGDHCEHYDSCHSNPCGSLGGCMNIPDRNYQCKCPSGKYGQQCGSTDPCSDKPCKNGATCIHLKQQEYSCKCAQDWYGIHCEKMNPCTNNPCLHGAECFHLGSGDYFCSCSKNYQGKLCEEEIACSPFEDSVCSNNGECVKQYEGRFVCECQEGHYGDRCEHYDPCLKDGLCHNGGECVAMKGREFLCRCLDGFYGDQCQYFTICKEEGYCSSGATCVQAATMTCYCPQGYTGPRCTEDLDECLSSPCHENAMCRNLPGSFVCDCLYGYNGPDCQIAATCPTETTHGARGTFIWTESSYGVAVGIECADTRGKYAKRDCVLQEDGTAQWSEPDTSACQLKIQNSSHAVNVLLRYRNVTSFKNSYELIQAKELLNAILPHSLNDSKVAEEFMAIIDKILSAPSGIIRTSEVANSQELRVQIRERCRKCGLLELLDEFMSHVPIIDHMTIRMTNFELYTKQNSYIEHEFGINFTPMNNPKAKISLPPEVFQRDQSNERVKFIHFRSNKLFNIQHGQPIAGEVDEVLSASVGRTETMNLQNCIEFTLPNMDSPRHAKCVFWDQKNQFWATDGLRKLTHSGFSTQCCSTHLSYFSVASNPDAAHIMMGQEHLYLSLTSYIGSAFAVLALGTVFTTYTIFSHLHRSSTGQILIQLSLSLVLLTVSLLLSRDRHQLSSGALCLVVAICCHFLFLTSLLWVCVLGQAVYVSLTKGEMQATSMYMLKRSLFAYGLPLVCVLITSLLQSSLYLYDLDTCHVAPQEGAIYYSLYLTPCGMAILCELVIILKLMRANCCGYKSQSTASDDSQKSDTTFWQTYGSISTMFFLTLSWVLKLTAAVTKKVDYTVYFGSAHFISNGIVGCCVCFFFFVMSSPARQAWTQCNRRNTLSSRQRVAGKGNVQSQNLSNESQYTLVGAKSKEPSSKDKPRCHRQSILHRSTTSDFTVPDSPVSTASGAQINRNSPQVNLNAKQSPYLEKSATNSSCGARAITNTPGASHTVRHSPYKAHITHNSPQLAHTARFSPHLTHFDMDQLDFTARTSRV